MSKKYQDRKNFISNVEHHIYNSIKEKNTHDEKNNNDLSCKWAEEIENMDINEYDDIEQWKNYILYSEFPPSEDEIDTIYIIKRNE